VPLATNVYGFRSEGQNLLVLQDGHSKWSEVKILAHIDASSLIETLQTLFAAYGLPEEVVSDNGPPFAFEQLANFFKRNAVVHTFTPTYHPKSNGSVEMTSFSQGGSSAATVRPPTSVSILCNIKLMHGFLTTGTPLTPPWECPWRTFSYAVGREHTCPCSIQAFSSMENARSQREENGR